MFVRTSADGGRSFGEPAHLESVGAPVTGDQRGPRAAVATTGLAVTAVVGNDLFAWTSKDGKTWSKAVRVSNEPGAAKDGYYDVAAGAGSMAAVWAGGTSGKAQLFVAVSRDGGTSWSAPAAITLGPPGSVSECTPPSIVIHPKGAITVAFRNSGNGARDPYWTRSTDSGKTWSEPRRFGTESWSPGACPVEGPSLSLDAAGKAMAAYRRGNNIYLCAEDSPAETLVGPGKLPLLVAAPRAVFWMGQRGLMLLSGPKPITFDKFGSNISAVPVDAGSILATWQNKDVVAFERMKP